MKWNGDTWRSWYSRKAIVLVSVSFLILFQVSLIGKSFLRKPTNSIEILGNSTLFSLVCRLEGASNKVIVGLPVCKLEHMNATLALWNEYKDEDHFYVFVDRQLRKYLDSSSKQELVSRIPSHLVDIDCNDWEMLNSTSSVCQRQLEWMSSLLKNTTISEIWIWNVENVVLLQSPVSVVQKIRKTSELVVKESAIGNGNIDADHYSVLVDTNDGHLRWIRPLPTTLKVNHAGQYMVEGLIVQALIVHKYPKHWNMFYSQSMENLSFVDAQVAYIYRQLMIGNQEDKSLENQELIFQSNICKQELVRLNEPNRYPIEDRFTVLLSTFNREQLVRRLVQHYQAIPLVHHIFVLWHNPEKQPSEELFDAVDDKKTFIVVMPFDSLNNRFLPLKGIETKGVLICDDDMFVHPEDILEAFQIWNESRDSLVGFFPRAHRKIHENEYEYVTHIPMDSKHNKYSVMLTKIEFMRSEYLFWYSCALDRRVLQFVRDKKNCEDIAMQMMVSGLTGKPPIAVKAKHNIGDYGQQISAGEQEPISFKPNHYTLRGECIGIFCNLAFQQHSVLVYNDAYG